jgi:hypothetical protein
MHPDHIPESARNPKEGARISQGFHRCVIYVEMLTFRSAGSAGSVIVTSHRRGVAASLSAAKAERCAGG